MQQLIRTTIIPWIAALCVLLTGATLAADDKKPQPKKKVRKVIVIEKKPTTAKHHGETVIHRYGVVHPHRTRGYWQPGGYEGRIGSPYYYSVPGGHYGHLTRDNGRYYPGHDGCRCGHGRDHHLGHAHRHYGNWSGSRWGSYGGLDPYTYHFGPGYYRRYEHGHYRFPYYSYRRPWYYPGQPVFNRDTNFAW